MSEREIVKLFRATLPILFLTQAAFASPDLDWIHSHHEDCLTQHLKEAIQVNRSRSKFYSAISKGGTNSVFKKLIFLDQTGLIFSSYFDHHSKKTLSKNGLPLLCEVIPSMLPTLNREVKLEPKISIEQFRPISLSSLYESKNLNEMNQAVEKLKEELNQEPRFNCLARHFVNSTGLLIRIAKESPSKNALPFAWKTIQALLLEMRLLTQIDREASTFQAQGIPLLCNELPELP